MMITVLLIACSDNPPVQPKLTPTADTTSHDWTFTLHTMDVGFNMIARDFDALAPDFAVMVFQGSEMQRPRNALLWNGSNLLPITLPYARLLPEDTCTVCPPERTEWYPSGALLGIHLLRRDNFWVSSINGATHFTVAGGDSDTMVYNARHWMNIPYFYSIERIWAYDSSNVFFVDDDASRVFHWRNNDRSWERYDLTYAPAPNRNDVWDIWGTSSDNVFLTSYWGTHRFDGGRWNTIWDASKPQLCDSVKFGSPCSVWAAADEDSMWIAGLVIGRMRKDGSGKVTFVHDGLAEESEQSFDCRCVRGSAKNNVFFVGLGGNLIHYNGASFRVFTEFHGQDIHFTKAAVFENDVLIIGYKPFVGGIFVHGQRN